MSKVAVCTSFYEAGRPFLDAFVSGLNAACPGHQVTLVAALHGIRDEEGALVELDENISVSFVQVSAAASIVEVRRRMLLAAVESDAEFLVLADMDDYLLPSGISGHVYAMEDADFSYGDMALIDEEGTDMGRTFYQGSNIPERLDGTAGKEAILTRNFLGFTNTALRRTCLDPTAFDIPDDLVAIDWWFYTKLLRDGHSGAKTGDPVSAYRTHAGNIHGGRADVGLSAVRRRIAICCLHCEAFTGNAEFDARRRTLERLSDWIAHDDASVNAVVEAACAGPGVWFDDIARLADWVTPG